jgi:Zn-dependent protease with chaperone function
VAAPVHRPGRSETATAIRATRRRAGLVAIAGAVVPGLVAGAVLALLVGWLAGLVAFCAVTVGGALVLWDRSTAIALRVVGATPSGEEDEPRLHNVVEGLCATFGLRMPELWTVNDPVPNACALGRSAHEAVIVVTSGLLQRLDPIALEGIVAHELAHVKRHETVLAGVAVAVLWPYARLTGRDDLLRAVVGRGREYQADALAASTVRYPPGLRDALAAMAAGPVPGAGSVFAPARRAATRWIWADPDPGGRRGSGGLDDVDVRIAALAEW